MADISKFTYIKCSSGGYIIQFSRPYYEPLDDIDPYIWNIFVYLKDGKYEIIYQGNTFDVPEIKVVGGEIFFNDVGPKCINGKKYDRKVKCWERQRHELIDNGVIAPHPLASQSPK